MPELATVRIPGRDVRVQVVNRWTFKGCEYAWVKALEGKPFGFGYQHYDSESFPSDLLENVQLVGDAVTVPGSAA